MLIDHSPNIGRLSFLGPVSTGSDYLAYIVQERSEKCIQSGSNLGLAQVSDKDIKDYFIFLLNEQEKNFVLILGLKSEARPLVPRIENLGNP